MQTSNQNILNKKKVSGNNAHYKHGHGLGIIIKESMQEAVFHTEMKFFKPLRSPFKA